MSPTQSRSKDESPAEQQAATSNVRNQTEEQPEELYVYASGLHVDVGNGQHVAIPETPGRPPTRDEIYQALVAAGHQARAGELAGKAHAGVTGTLEG
jgi:hypothetical protein